MVHGLWRIQPSEIRVQKSLLIWITYAADCWGGGVLKLPSSLTSSKRTLIRFETPDSSIVTPCKTSATVIDRSTYREPALPPIGIRYVIVNGVVVVSDGQPVRGVTPGRPVRAAVAAR